MAITIDLNVTTLGLVPPIVEDAQDHFDGLPAPDESEPANTGDGYVHPVAPPLEQHRCNTVYCAAASGVEGDGVDAPKGAGHDGSGAGDRSNAVPYLHTVAQMIKWPDYEMLTLMAALLDPSPSAVAALLEELKRDGRFLRRLKTNPGLEDEPETRIDVSEINRRFATEPHVEFSGFLSGVGPYWDSETYIDRLRTKVGNHTVDSHTVRGIDVYAPPRASRYQLSITEGEGRYVFDIGIFHHGLAGRRTDLHNALFAIVKSIHVATVERIEAGMPLNGIYDSLIDRVTVPHLLVQL